MVLRMTDLEETEEKRIVSEFCHLFDKSKQLFNGLRDLPPYGHKQWQTYFGRAFDVYTRLWKFQQQHRLLLDRKYSLKRWQIGEIASRIGQLYYHYYLRTSETNYLNEAFQFYGAIRARGYYSKREERSDLTLKKLRYFARFIVVCLLLKRMKNVRDLIRELSQHIDDYTSAYEPDDQLEWNLVLNEIRSFAEADAPVTIFDSNGEQVVLTYRLSPLTTPPVEKSSQMTLHLQEILIVGTKADQVKFSELTMDMFRMLQTLEREPTDESQSIPCLRRENPHKHLLYKPSLESFIVYLSSGWKDVEPGGVLLLYISGDPVPGGSEEISGGIGTGYYDSGGVLLAKREDSKHSPRRYRYVGEPVQCLHPGDIVPFTRKPLFAIIESENSHVFQDLVSPFGVPLVILMSAPETPTFLQENRGNGSLLTLFLHCPLSGFCMITGLNSLTFPVWDLAQTYVDRFMAEGSRVFLQGGRDDVYVDFFGDDFLRLLILRFVFFDTVLRFHRSFQSPAHHPRSQPELSLQAISSSLARIIMELAQHLSVGKMFFDT